MLSTYLIRKDQRFPILRKRESGGGAKIMSEVSKMKKNMREHTSNRE